MSAHINLLLNIKPCYQDVGSRRRGEGAAVNKDYNKLSQFHGIWQKKWSFTPTAPRHFVSAGISELNVLDLHKMFAPVAKTHTHRG